MKTCTSPDLLIPDVRSNGVAPLPFSLNSSSTSAFTFQSTDDIKDYLSCLQDDHSTFMDVAKACHFLNQFGTHGSYNSMPSNVVQSNILKIEQYTSDISHILNTLSNTATNHVDRRCRIVAVQSLSTIANSSLTKLITTPSLYSNREDSIHISRMQIFICNDIVLNIVNCIVNDDDDGVSSIAVESLSHFLHNDISNKNEIMKEIYYLKCQSMAKNNHLIPRRSMWDGEGGSYGCGGYADSVQDVDYTKQRADLQWRIMEHVLGPRVRKLFVRVCLYKERQHKIRCLGVMNDIMIFVYKTERARRGTKLGKNGFSKRWFEFDSTVLLSEYIDIFLIPLLRIFNEDDGDLSVVMNALMICHVVKQKDIWFNPLIRLSIQNLESRLVRSKENGQIQEIQSSLVAMLLIALRGIQRLDRIALLVLIADVVAKMPSAHYVPKGVISPVDITRLMPNRIGFWSEMAFAILLPDELSRCERTMKVNTARRKSDNQSTLFALNHFLNSAPIQALLQSRNSIEMECAINPVDEIVYVFCSVAYSIGKRICPWVEACKSGNIMNSDGSSHDENSQSSSHEHADEWCWIPSEYNSWLYASIDLLKTFYLCFTWNRVSNESTSCSFTRSSHSSQVELAMSSTICFSCQRAYLELLKVVLMATGYLNNQSSIFLHFCCSISTKADDSRLQASSNRSSLDFNLTIENELNDILDTIMQLLNQSETVLRRKLRIAFLAIVSDVWVQYCDRIMLSKVGLHLDQEEVTGPVDIDEDVANINEQRARDLLSLLGSEISKLLDEEKSRCSTYDTNIAGEAQRSITACIAAVETIGCTSQRLKNHFSDSHTNKEIVESAKYIVSMCTVVLKGQGMVEVETEADLHDGLINRESQSKASNYDSPTRSPRSKALATILTNECTNSARRLQEFIGLCSKDSFNYTCPLFQRSDYGVDQDDTVNDIWILCDRFSLLELSCDSYHRNPNVTPLQVTEETFFYSPLNFCDGIRESGYFIQLYRQLLCNFVQQNLERSLMSPLRFLKITHRDNNLSRVIPQKNIDLLRLGTPPIPIEHVPSGLKLNETKIMFSNSATALSSGSDPLAIASSYSIRQVPRFDGNFCWFFVVSVTVYNKTQVPIENGIKIDATILNESSSPTFKKSVLHESAVSKGELEPGGHFIWEFVTSSLFSRCKLCITTTLLDIATENSIYEKPLSEENAYDYSSDILAMLEGNEEEGDETVDVVLHGEAVSIPSIIILQPNPLIFYRNSLGDQTSFQFLWFSMPHTLPVIKIIPNRSMIGSRNAVRVLAVSSIMNVLCSENGGTKTVSSWAFSTWCGSHNVLIMATSDIRSSPTIHESSLVVKGDDIDLLNEFCICQKKQFVSDLTEGKFSAL